MASELGKLKSFNTPGPATLIVNEKRLACKADNASPGRTSSELEHLPRPINKDPEAHRCTGMKSQSEPDWFTVMVSCLAYTRAHGFCKSALQTSLPADVFNLCHYRDSMTKHGMYLAPIIYMLVNPTLVSFFLKEFEHLQSGNSFGVRQNLTDALKSSEGLYEHQLETGQARGENAGLKNQGALYNHPRVVNEKMVVNERGFAALMELGRQLRVLINLNPHHHDKAELLNLIEGATISGQLIMGMNKLMHMLRAVLAAGDIHLDSTSYAGVFCKMSKNQRDGINLLLNKDETYSQFSIRFGGAVALKYDDYPEQDEAQFTHEFDMSFISVLACETIHLKGKVGDDVNGFMKMMSRIPGNSWCEHMECARLCHSLWRKLNVPHLLSHDYPLEVPIGRIGDVIAQIRPSTFRDEHRNASVELVACTKKDNEETKARKALSARDLRRNLRAAAHNLSNKKARWIPTGVKPQV